jgi:HEAT repeat protein
MEDPYEGIRVKAKRGLRALVARGVQAASEVLDRYPLVKDEESIDDFLKLGDLETGAVTGAGEDAAVELPPAKGIVYNFDHADGGVRAAEARRVVDNDDRGYAPRLVEILRKEADVNARIALIGAIAKLGYKPAVDLLIASLADRDPKVRASAVDGLAVLKMDKGFAKVIGSLKDADPSVRVRAILALHQYPHIDTLPFLKQMAGHGKDEFRKAALKTIAQLKTFNAIPLLEPLAQDRATDIRMEALTILRTLRKEGNAVAKSILSRLGMG